MTIAAVANRGAVLKLIAGFTYGSRSATTAAKIWGKITTVRTTIAENQNIARLARLRRRHVPRDRYNWMNPTPSSASDNPISQLRSGSIQTPRLAPPAAAAMPTGRQHARVESARSTAPVGAIFLG